LRHTQIAKNGKDYKFVIEREKRMKIEGEKYELGIPCGWYWDERGVWVGF
jgi:hypothetical protein